MDTKLTSAAFAAAMFASGAAWAQQATSSAVTDQDQAGSKTTTTTTTETKTEKGKAGGDTTTKAQTKAKAKPTSGATKSSETKSSDTKGSDTKSSDDQTGKSERDLKNEAEAAKPRPEPTAAEREDARKKAEKAGNAVGRTTTTAAAAVTEAARDVTRATDQPGKYNPLAIEWNPLGLFVGGRLSFNVEWAPATHHVIIASPHFASTGSTIDVGPNQTADQRFTGVGGELGYRYYSGRRGMNGVFIGPSIIAGAYNADLPSGERAFTNIGIAADVGVQQVFFDHLVLGAGVGLEYLKVSKDFNDLPSGPSTIAQDGLKPRLLASGGYAF